MRSQPAHYCCGGGNEVATEPQTTNTDNVSLSLDIDIVSR